METRRLSLVSPMACAPCRGRQAREADGLCDAQVVLETTARGDKLMHRKEGRVRASEALRRVVEKGHDFAAMLNPALLPMLVRPAPWSAPLSGGYLKAAACVMRTRGDPAQVRKQTGELLPSTLGCGWPLVAA